MRPLPPVTPLPLQPGPQFPRVHRDDPLSIHIRDKSDPHHVRDRLVDIGVLRKNGDGSYSPYLPAKADLVDGKVPESQLPADKQGVTEVLVDGVSVVSGGTASISLAEKVDKEQGKGLSSNDYTTEEKTKLTEIEAGAQVNAVQTVKMAGTVLAPDAQKAVNIPAASTTQKGVVQLSNSTGSTSTSLAATADAVRRANENANGRISRTDDSTYESGSPVTADVDFTGGVSFKSAPAVKADGFTNLIFFYDVYDPETGSTRPEPAFEMSGTDATVEWWDGSAGETEELLFNEWFSDNVYDAADQHGAVPHLSAYFSNSASFFDSVPLYYDKYDEETGGYTAEWLMDARAEFPPELSPGGTWQVFMTLWLYRQDMESWEEGAYLGYVDLSMTWTVNDGKVDVSTSYCGGEIYPQDVEGEPVNPYIEYDSPLWAGTFYASTDPDGYGYDPVYEEYPDEYGWRPDVDTKLATMADVSSLPESALLNLPASKITSGTFSTDRIPGLAASKITSGTFDAARIPSLAMSGITGLNDALDAKLTGHGVGGSGIPTSRPPDGATYLLSNGYSYILVGNGGRTVYLEIPVPHNIDSSYDGSAGKEFWAADVGLLMQAGTSFTVVFCAARHATSPQSKTYLRILEPGGGGYRHSRTYTLTGPTSGGDAHAFRIRVFLTNATYTVCTIDHETITDFLHDLDS